MKPLQNLDSKISSKKLIYEVFGKTLVKDLQIQNQTSFMMPINGGWGYSKDDAVVIEKIDKDFSFDGVDIEYIFAKYRSSLEMIATREKEEQFFDIKLKFISQELIKDNDNIYDKLIFDVSAFHTDNFKKRDKKAFHFQREYWFEISSFYGEYKKLELFKEENIFLKIFKSIF